MNTNTRVVSAHFGRHFGVVALDCGSHVVVRVGLWFFNVCFDVRLQR